MSIQEQSETSTPTSKGPGHGPSFLTHDEPSPKPPILVCVLLVPEGAELPQNSLRHVVSREISRLSTSPERHLAQPSLTP